MNGCVFFSYFCVLDYDTIDYFCAELKITILIYRKFEISAAQ